MFHANLDINPWRPTPHHNWRSPPTAFGHSSAAAIWAIVDVLVWTTVVEHGGGLPSRFDPLTWHIHEVLFGFIMAAIAGFLLTAVANWTGRPPIRGPLLAMLAIAWLAGRMARS